MRHAVATAALFVGLVGTSALGQNEPKIQEFANWIVENQSDLAKYRWTERLALENEGTSSATRLFRVRHNADGLLRRRPLGTEVDREFDPDTSDSPLSRRIDTNDEEVAETDSDLPVDLLRRVESYTHMQPGRAQAVYSRAVPVDESDPNSTEPDEVTSKDDAPIADGSEQAEIRPDRRHFRIEDALSPGDQLDLWIDRETHHLRRLVILTLLDEIPVNITTEFTDLPDGPTYAARTIVETTSDELPLLFMTESFDFARKGSK